MKTQTRTSQGGSVVSFLVVGVILTVITLSAVYFAQQRGQQGQSPSAAPSPSVSPSASPSASPKPVSPSPQPSSTPSSAPQAGHLPSTGPTDDLILGAIPIAILAGATIAYIRSRSDRFSSLYR